MSKLKKTIVQRRTLLIVGEGSDEKAFLSYLKEHLVPRGTGLMVTIKNAKGKGAKGVLDYTIKQIRIPEYDTVAALFDTDTDWTDALVKQAKKHKVLLLKSEPCFEAMLFRLLGITPELNSKKLKAQFAPFVNHKATHSEQYAKHFNPEKLEAMQHTEPTIEMLLSLFKL
ncbi:MAG: RloB domain-containing protein [Methylococcaceae bacterium]